MRKPALRRMVLPLLIALTGRAALAQSPAESTEPPTSNGPVTSGAPAETPEHPTQTVELSADELRAIAESNAPATADELPSSAADYTVIDTPVTPPVAVAADTPDFADEAEAPSDWTAEVSGEYRFRFHWMTDLPLQTQARSGLPGELGQNTWGTQWLRLSPSLRYRDLKVSAQFDAFRGMVFGDTTIGVEDAIEPRNEAYPFALHLRSLYAEWKSPFGLLRAGLQPSHWGLGLLANDGNHAQPFGDYQFGNRNIRLLFATKPGGADSPLTIALAGDYVIFDPIADHSRGDRAFQAVAAITYGVPGKQVGAYAVYRSQTSEAVGGGVMPQTIQESLSGVIVDLFGEYSFADPRGGELFAAAEAVYIHGSTNLTRNADFTEQDLRQGMAAIQFGRRSERFDVVFEGGFASGDANPHDGTQRRATMNPDHRVGLILFPEMLAWSSARSAALARSEELAARATPGSERLPTNGGVSGAGYIFNYMNYRALPWLDVSLGWVWGRASTDVVDVYRARAESAQVNWRGGDRSGRGIGFEIDASVVAQIPLVAFGDQALALELGLEGGIALPGAAFDAADGSSMPTQGLFRARAGLGF